MSGGRTHPDAWRRAGEADLRARSDARSVKKLKQKTLRIARDLNLPLDAVTQKIAWLGRTGSGKTFGCKQMVEQMLLARAQVVILDGAGGWAGLRLGPKALDIPVLGGLYGDIPLEPTGGALVADVIVDSGTSVVLDVSQMLDAERTRFATAFAQRFFQRKKAAPSAVHLVLEECQDFVPQNSEPGEHRMLHEFQRLAKQGRAHGIGMSFLSQRPQEISKKALNQVECVFAFQMTGPHERKALQYWLSDKGMTEKLEDILPKLEIGAPHIWSPQWLKISRVVKILPIETLDTSRTPKVGERAFKQQKLTPINLKELTTAMAETVERAKLEDPKALRARIAELEKKPEPAKVDWDNVDRWVMARLEDGIKKIRLEVGNALVDMRVVNKGEFPAKRLAKAPTATARSFLQSFQADERPKAPHPQAASVPRTNGEGPTGGLRRMMIALARRPGITNRQIAIRAGMSLSGTFATYLSRARQRGWIRDDGPLRYLEQAGFDALGGYEPLPEGKKLLDYWLKELGVGVARILAALARAYPAAMSNEELAHSAEMTMSGTFATYLSRLRKLELIEGGRGQIRMSPELAE